VNNAEGWFTFMLVSFTQAKIVVPLKEVGDQVGATMLFEITFALAKS